MSLAPGEQLGHYKIVSLIGKGGMGEVYRASDLTLKRDVALKILPAVFSSDPDRVARFQREAEVLAALNHSNIASIHGVVESDTARALVMEYVEGESPRGPMPFEDAWKIQGNYRTYDVEPDGQHFLTIKYPNPAPQATSDQLTIVFNWFEELRRRAPLQK
jgi:serine/threonine protein kinase